MYDYVFQIIMENHGLNDSPIIDPGHGIWKSTISCPYINNTLINGGALAINFTPSSGGISLPNYIQMFCGNDFGIVDDLNPPTHVQAVGQKSFIDQVEAAGKTWKLYAEGYLGGAGTSTITDGDLVPYREHHVPHAYFDSIRLTPARCLKVQDFTNFAADFSPTSTATTPNHAFIVPNNNDNMHDGTPAAGDSWLQTNVGTILASAAWKSGRALLAVMWDESTAATSLLVPVIFYDAGSLGAVKVNYTTATAHIWPEFLATLQWVMGLQIGGCGQGDQTNNYMTECFNFPADERFDFASSGRHFGGIN